ncbi:MAG: ribonuclease III [Elusimicrobia bacterium]|nr:ribonuclease III [Elusimicrobiota bacterium]
MTELESVLGVKFRSQKLLTEARTHKSYAMENKSDVYNERLEFLGDSVLSCVVAEYLFARFPASPEGYLAKLKSQIVSRGVLAGWSRKINLGNYVLMSKGEEITGGRDRDNMLADTLEAMIGAIYLDRGFDTAKKFVREYIANKKLSLEYDYKSKLQEIVQSQSKALPSYEVTKESGPEHKKVFEMVVRIKKKVFGKGTGNSKKEAEQESAKQALIRLKTQGNRQLLLKNKTN